MFYSNPNLLNLVAEIMGTAPRLAEVLSRNPNRLDAVLTPGFFDALPDRASLAEQLDLLLAQARDFEDVLNIARRWTNDQIVWPASTSCATSPTASAAGRSCPTSPIWRCRRWSPASPTNSPAARPVRRSLHGDPGAGQAGQPADDAALRPGPHHGLRRAARSTASDGPVPLAPNEYFIRLTQRMINALTAPTGEGRLYDIDMPAPAMPARWRSAWSPSPAISSTTPGRGSTWP